MKLSRKKIIIYTGIIALFIALIIIGKNRNSGEIEVNTSNVEKRTIVSTVSANGKIKPEEEVKISADVSGEIVELYVNEGDTVKNGELILKIDPDLYISALDRARAGLNSAQSTYKTNQALLTQAESRFNGERASYERNVKLHDDGVISDAEFDAAKASYEVIEADVKAALERISAAEFGIANARATLSEAEKNLARTKIFAPTDGIVSVLNAEKGERVVGTAQMAGTEILVISNLNNMEVIVDVNENDILEISKGDTTIIEVDAYRDRKFKGIVSEISKSASGSGIQASTEQVTNFVVKVRILKSSYNDLLDETDAPFLTGMSANVEIQTTTKRNISCLPIEAVSTRNREFKEGEEKSTGAEEELDEVVFTIKDGKAVKNIVKTGIQDNRYIEIVEGIVSDDKIIVGPYDAVSKRLEDGKAVTVVKKKDLTKLE